MISLKTPQEIETMREGGRILGQIMKELQAQVRPGISTDELDQYAESQILKARAKPAFKNYQGFPRTLCASVNEEVVHAVPSKERILKEGDIITLDLGLVWPARRSLLDSRSLGEMGGEGGEGYYLDMARTAPVGQIAPEAARLIRITKKALRLGIKKARPGNTAGDIGNTIQRFIESQGYNVVRELCGHGIGRQLHEEPEIPNFGKRHEGPELAKGMVICIEPMVAMGDWKVKKTKDGFGFATADGSLSCHFEDTIAITPLGSEVLTILK